MLLFIQLTDSPRKHAPGITGSTVIDPKDTSLKCQQTVKKSLKSAKEFFSDVNKNRFFKENLTFCIFELN